MKEDIPTLSDSILTVKNDLMIPDDFMPDYMMRLVERLIKRYMGVYNRYNIKVINRQTGEM